MKTIWSFLLAFILLVNSFGFVSAQGGSKIMITDLGVLSGGTSSLAGAINNLGEVIGISQTATDFHIFLWTETNGITDLGKLGFSSSRIYAEFLDFNDNGQIAGTAFGPAVFNTAFFWSASTGPIDLGSLGLGSSIYARAINNLGQVVGYGTTNSGIAHAILWSQTTELTDLGAFDGMDTFALGINDLGQIVGFVRSSEDIAIPFLRSVAGDVSYLDIADAYATDINNFGQIVGAYPTATGDLHPYIWAAGSGMTDLGALPGYYYCYPNSINNYGNVVGVCEDDFMNPHAFLWTSNSGMMDLGTLGGNFSWAWSINDFGQVVGYSETASGETHATLWEFSSLTPEEQIMTLEGQVRKLVSDSKLNGGQGNSLVTKLDNALLQMAKNKPAVACNTLKAFTNQVYSLISEGVLSHNDGQNLIDSANEVIGQVCQ